MATVASVAMNEKMIANDPTMITAIPRMRKSSQWPLRERRSSGRGGGVRNEDSVLMVFSQDDSRDAGEDRVILGKQEKIGKLNLGIEVCIRLTAVQGASRQALL
jgi:hypothetical protein